jgi:hypothetical protein
VSFGRRHRHSIGIGAGWDLCFVQSASKKSHIVIKGSMESESQRENAEKRERQRLKYKRRRQFLIENGVAPDRGPGRPRKYDPAEALLVQQQQKKESYQRSREQIRAELARRGMLGTVSTLVC